MGGRRRRCARRSSRCCRSRSPTPRPHTARIGSRKQPLVQRVGQGALRVGDEHRSTAAYTNDRKGSWGRRRSSSSWCCSSRSPATGRRVTAVKVGLIVGGFVIVAPLVLALIGQDYWLARNVIPAFIPIVTAIAAACVVPRARVVGGALALADARDASRTRPTTSRRRFGSSGRSGAMSRGRSGPRPSRARSSSPTGRRAIR